MPQAHSRHGLRLSDSFHSPYYRPTSPATLGLITTPEFGQSHLGGRKPEFLPNGFTKCPQQGPIPLDLRRLSGAIWAESSTPGPRERCSGSPGPRCKATRLFCPAHPLSLLPLLIHPIVTHTRTGAGPANCLGLLSTTLTDQAPPLLSSLGEGEGHPDLPASPLPPPPQCTRLYLTSGLVPAGPHITSPPPCLSGTNPPHPSRSCSGRLGSNQALIFRGSWCSGKRSGGGVSWCTH